MILYFLHKLVEVLAEYFDGLEDESIRDNFVVTYELLDEMMDNGYPQITEEKVLREYIKTESNKLNKSEKISDAQVPIAVSNIVSWRAEGIKYSKNEIFLDVVEKLNLLVLFIIRILKKHVHLVGIIKWHSAVFRNHWVCQDELFAQWYA